KTWTAIFLSYTCCRGRLYKCIKCCACVKSCPEGARSLSSPFAPVLSANFSLRKSPIMKV
ncbi:4Fe-4S binding protein, partial [uncultured Duncaniella sp.]|uniref:4Fe-4S binding protein n=1 Tax=uncultured Duncaniella sp. TaxID=2768039 RepID=UPI0025B66028